MIDLKLHKRYLGTTKKYVYVLLCYALVSVFASFLANDKPLFCSLKGQWFFPAFSSNQSVSIGNESSEIINYNMGNAWKLIDADVIIFAPCAYSPNTIDAENAPKKSPFAKQLMLTKNGELIPLPLKFRHWLGTTQNGTDVLSNLIHGTQVAMSIGFFSMLLTGVICFLMCAFAGYYQNNTLKIGLVQLLFFIPSIILAWFYAFSAQELSIIKNLNAGGVHLIFQILKSFFVFILIAYFIQWICFKGDKKLKWNKYIDFSVDIFILKIIEILNSIPSLLLIVTISSLTKPSTVLLISIIGFLGWTGIARIMRAEFLKAKQLDYVTSARAIGLNHFSIIFKHIMPNVLPSLFIQLVFVMAGSIILESSLSFIGIGTPIETASWGRLLNEARNNLDAWWLLVFPGLSLLVLTICFYKISSESTNKNITE